MEFIKFRSILIEYMDQPYEKVSRDFFEFLKNVTQSDGLHDHSIEEVWDRLEHNKYSLVSEFKRSLENRESTNNHKVYFSQNELGPIVRNSQNVEWRFLNVLFYCFLSKKISEEKTSFEILLENTPSRYWDKFTLTGIADIDSRLREWHLKKGSIIITDEEKQKIYRDLLSSPGVTAACRSIISSYFNSDDFKNEIFAIKGSLPLLALNSVNEEYFGTTFSTACWNELSEGFRLSLLIWDIVTKNFNFFYLYQRGSISFSDSVQGDDFISGEKLFINVIDQGVDYYDKKRSRTLADRLAEFSSWSDAKKKRDEIIRKKRVEEHKQNLAKKGEECECLGCNENLGFCVAEFKDYEESDKRWWNASDPITKEVNKASCMCCGCSDQLGFCLVELAQEEGRDKKMLELWESQGWKHNRTLGLLNAFSRMKEKNPLLTLCLAFNRAITDLSVKEKSVPGLLFSEEKLRSFRYEVRNAIIPVLDAVEYFNEQNFYVDETNTGLRLKGRPSSTVNNLNKRLGAYISERLFVVKKIENERIDKYREAVADEFLKSSITSKKR